MIRHQEEPVSCLLYTSMLAVLLLVCGIYALIVVPGAVDGLKYYFVPDFSQFGMQQFADACMQVCFSVGIGWGIFTTLGASMDKDANLKADAWWVDICDTFIAVSYTHLKEVSQDIDF